MHRRPVRTHGRSCATLTVEDTVRGDEAADTQRALMSTDATARTINDQLHTIMELSTHTLVVSRSPK